MNLLKLLGGKSVEKGLDLADQYILDKDKAEELKARIIEKQMELDAQATTPLIDGIHKLGRQLLSAGIMVLYYATWKEGNPIPLTDMLAIVAPSAAYIVAKGRGK